MRRARLVLRFLVILAMLMPPGVLIAPAVAQETGIAVKKPVFGGACKVCPWGAIGDIVKEAMQPYGYDVKMCYNCAGGPAEARLVAAAKTPPPLTEAYLARLAGFGVPASQLPPPPNGPIDFGVTTTNLLDWAYHGTHDFAGEGPKDNLRLIAVIQAPLYLIVAAKKELGITDLSQIKEKRWPVRVLWDAGVNGEMSKTVLAYYGLDKASIEAAGGHVGLGIIPEERKDFDVVIYQGDLSAAPEFNIWYEVSQKYDLTYLHLPDVLLDKLAAENGMIRKDIPDGMLRGLFEKIPTVAFTGNAIYARTDTPDDFAYAVAKAVDEHQELFAWAYQHYSYNPRNVWKNYDVPLHAGAARYYREVGYMK